jgi:hypothetical protein
MSTVDWGDIPNIQEGKMGRTVLPNSDVLEKESCKLIRKVMSKEDQEAFDRLFDRAKLHTHAPVYQANSLPMETILLSTAWNTMMIEEILPKSNPKLGDSGRSTGIRKR